MFPCFIDCELLLTKKKGIVIHEGNTVCGFKNIPKTFDLKRLCYLQWIIIYLIYLGTTLALPFCLVW